MGYFLDGRLTLPWDYFWLARQPAMIAFNRDQIGRLPTTQDLPLRRAGKSEFPSGEIVLITSTIPGLNLQIYDHPRNRTP
jgi:hypothetical protein